MKKRLSALIFTALLLAGCAGSAPSAQTGGAQTMTVYRVNLNAASKSDDLIQSSVEPLPAGMRAGVDAALTLLAANTKDGVAAESWTLSEGVLTLEMNDAFLALDRMDMTLAAFCAALTLCGLEEVEAVTVTAGGQTLYQGLVPEDGLLRDTDTDPYTRQLRLYFADGAGRYLLSEYHSLTVAENTPLERYVVEELLRGPNSGELHSVIPAGTELLACSAADGVCTVDLSAAFLENRPQTVLGERLTVYSLVNSLTALSTVDSVRILVQGQPVGVYVRRDLSAPLERCEAAIGPASAAKGELDADLYRALPGLAEFAAMPMAVEPADRDGEAQAVLTALLETQEPGFPVLFSGADCVTSVQVTGLMCTVDVTESFFASMDTPAARDAAVRSIAATLCGVGQIRSVRFTVDGADAAFDGVSYVGPWTAQDCATIP